MASPQITVFMARRIVTMDSPLPDAMLDHLAVCVEARSAERSADDR